MGSVIRDDSKAESHSSALSLIVDSAVGIECVEFLVVDGGFVNLFSAKLPARDVEADVVVSADVRVIASCNGEGFAMEAVAQIFPLCDVIGKDFDGDGAVETGVASFVDFAHAAGTDRGEDFVRAEFVAGGEGHVVMSVAQKP